MTPALLLLLAAPVGPPAPQSERRQAIAMRWDVQTKSCVATVRGVDTGDVSSDRGRAALAAALPDKGAALHVSGTDGVPYECVADLVDTLHRSGYYGSIGMTTGPAQPRAMP